MKAKRYRATDIRRAWLPKSDLLVMVLSLALIVPALAAPLSAATNVPGGNASGTWDAAGSPYLIDGDITVQAGQALTIEPGVEALFQNWYSLTVNGTLIADGTEIAPILFGGGHETAGWLGIRFVDAPDGSSLLYVTVSAGILLVCPELVQLHPAMAADYLSGVRT